MPKELPQWLRLSVDVPAREHVFVRLHEVIRENAEKLYAGMSLSDAALFRVTRDAEVEFDGDEDENAERPKVRPTGLKVLAAAV